MLCFYSSAIIMQVESLKLMAIICVIHLGCPSGCAVCNDPVTCDYCYEGYHKSDEGLCSRKCKLLQLLLVVWL